MSYEDSDDRSHWEILWLVLIIVFFYWFHRWCRTQRGSVLKSTDSPTAPAVVQTDSSNAYQQPAAAPAPHPVVGVNQQLMPPYLEIDPCANCIMGPPPPSYETTISQHQGGYQKPLPYNPGHVTGYTNLH